MGNFSIQLGNGQHPGLLPQAQRFETIQKGRNPYQTSKALPANSPVFVGREVELQRIRIALGDKHNPEHVSLMGESRIGKTSLLNQLRESLANEKDFVCISCNAQCLGEASQQQFFHDVIIELAEGLNEPKPTQDQTFADFRDYISQLARHYRFILMLDEFEVLADNPHYDKTFFDNLRSLGDEPKHRFTFFVISHAPLKALCHSGSIKGSRFWNNFTVRTLGLLAKTDISQLIDCVKIHAGITISVNYRDMINHCGSHPLLLQKTLNETTQAKLHNWKIDMENLQSGRILIYEMLWQMRNKSEIALLFTTISGQAVSSGRVSKNLHQRGLMANNKLFCLGFAESIPEALIPNAETPESFLKKIKEDPGKALKSAERWNKWFDLLEKYVSRISKVWKIFKNEEPEE